MKRFMTVEILRPKAIVTIQRLDKDMIAHHASIALREYEKAGYKNAGPINNFLGVAAELAFKACLTKLGFKEHADYEYNKRKPDYWKHDPRKYDFKMANGVTIEIASAKPTHDHCLIKASEWKQSDYAISVQFKNLLCYAAILVKGNYLLYEIDAAKGAFPQPITDYDKIQELEATEQENIGECEIVGYGTREQIKHRENGWFYSREGIDYLTPNASAYACPLDYLREHGKITELWRLLKANA